MGRNRKPLYSYWDGQKLDYIEARKKIYIPLYSRGVIKTDAFKQLLELYKTTDKDIYLVDFDGYNHKKLNMSLKGELTRAIAQIAHDPEVSAVLLTGNGKAFSAGGDIGEMALNTSVTVSRERLQKLLADIFIPLHEFQQ
jgi:hypothetical protein